MANDWFRFKQFKVMQQRSAMKVSTDACILGAWTASVLKNRLNDKTDLLDIGTGTGLLSLMLAQEFPFATIDAIDTDAAAIEEAKTNFLNSPWQQRLNARHIALQQYRPGKKYDSIICNPPFFHKQLQATGISRNAARHDISLSKNDLAHHASLLLQPNGCLSVLFPVSEWDNWLEAATAEGLSAQAILRVLPGVDKPANRIISLFTPTPDKPIQSMELTIRETADRYTTEFTRLMQPYYLYL